jgi:hypothetical protein
MTTFADKVIDLISQLRYDGAPLPQDIRVLNPYLDNAQAMQIASAFYRKYYDDHKPRRIILGINPGRFGGAVTGVPFTDTKRLRSACNIPFAGRDTHEPSSVFIYEMIAAFGGPEAFYGQFYISSVFPLALTRVTGPGKEKNYNYYDSKTLLEALRPYMVENIRRQIALGVRTDVGFCFGTGKNEANLRRLNEQYRFFDKIVALEHPRFVVQYRARDMRSYIDKYLAAFAGN